MFAKAREAYYNNSRVLFTVLYKNKQIF